MRMALFRIQLLWWCFVLNLVTLRLQLAGFFKSKQSGYNGTWHGSTCQAWLSFLQCQPTPSVGRMGLPSDIKMCSEGVAAVGGPGEGVTGEASSRSLARGFPMADIHVKLLQYQISAMRPLGALDRTVFISPQQVMRLVKVKAKHFVTLERHRAIVEEC